VLCQIQQADFCLKDKEGVFYKLKDLFLLLNRRGLFYASFICYSSMTGKSGRFKLELFAKTVNRIRAVTHVAGKIKRGVHHECKQ
jgi:hypothetical protein